MVLDNVAAGESPNLNAPVLQGKSLQRMRTLLASALKGARAYDGTLRAEASLIARLSSLERLLRHTRGAVTLTREHSERALLRQAYGSRAINARSRAMTISELLDVAVANFRRKLLSAHIHIKTMELPFCLVPTERKRPAVIRGGGGFEFNRLDDTRESEILVLLVRKGICIDELTIYTSILPTNSLRQVPYRLIQIPRLKREILVCGQVGQRTFVGRGVKGPLFWATYSKDQLLQHPDVSSVIAQDRWLKLLEEELFTNNTLIARRDFKLPAGLLVTTAFPLTEELIIVNSLRWATEHDWNLPTAHHGVIPWLPGQDWKVWDNAIRQCSRGLTRPCRGLSHLLAIYGLKHSRGSITEVVREAWDRVLTGQPHGLSVSESDRSSLTVDFILTKALKWASTHGWSLPQRSSGEIPGVVVDTWFAWSTALRGNIRNLNIVGCKGLAHLFELYGLRSGHRDRSEVIEAAWRRVERGEPHGLLIEAPLQLTEELILSKAVEYASAHDWRLPVGRPDAVLGLSGEDWAGWCWALRLQRRGLSRQGCRGLAHLLTLYGLKEGRTSNVPLLKQAWARMQKGDAHNLREIEDAIATLTEEQLLAKAREWSEANEGKAPQPSSGAVPGWSISWKIANAAVQRQSGRLSQPYENLAHLFRVYQFTSGKVEATTSGDSGVGLTDDLILDAAIKWSAGHDWLLPKGSSGIVPGIVGQTWRDCGHAARARRSGCRFGLTALFQDYGLMRGRAVLAAEVRAAWARIQAGKSHGLTNGQSTLTEDLILSKAVEWAALHRWQLPQIESGAVPGRAGDTWWMINNALIDGLRGLVRLDCKGLLHLFRIFGLQRKSANNIELIKTTWDRICSGQAHGLIEVPSDTEELSETLILTKAVEWAAKHDWQLPSRHDGAVPGLLGDTWLRITLALKDARRGLIRKHCPGLLALYQIYGLMRGYQINVRLLKQTWKNMQRGRPLGLTDDHGEEHRLTEVIIIERALQWAKTHRWRLPRADSGTVPGRPGDTWQAFDKAIKCCNRGLTRRDCRGLAHLYRLYKFERDKTTDRPRLKEASAAATAGALEAYLQLHLSQIGPAAPTGYAASAAA